MLILLISIFIETLSLSFILLLLDGALTMSSAWIACSVSILTTAILLRMHLLYHYSETMLFQSFVYKKIVGNFFINFFKNIYYVVKLLVSDIKSSVVIDSMEIDNNTWRENAIACNCINICPDIIVSLVDNKNIKIHSINSKKYMRNTVAEDFTNLNCKMYYEELF